MPTAPVQYQIGRTLWSRRAVYQVFVQGARAGNRHLTLCGAKPLGVDGLGDVAGVPVFDLHYDCQNCRRVLKSLFTAS